MQTEPPTFTVSDSHCHFFSHFFLKTIAGQKWRENGTVQQAAEALGWDAPPEEPALLSDQWAAELERNHVSRAALIASVPGDEASVAAAVSRHPERFVGFFMLDPTRDDAPQRVRRALTEQGLRCPCLFPAMHRYALGDACVRKTLDAAVEAGGSALFVHCGMLSVGFRKRLGLPSPFDLSLGNPLALVPVAASYPTLRFIVPHFGSGLLREALMLADACSNVYLDTSSSNSWVKYQGLTLREAYRTTTDAIGTGRLLFGTDSSFFPRGWHRAVFESQRAILDQLNIEAPAQADIFGGNFDRLFPLS